MERRHRSIVQKVSLILASALTLSFVSGCFAMYRLEKSNTGYIYQLTGDLVRSSIRDMEEELKGIDATLYNMIVSNEIQEAGSLLIGETVGSTVSAYQQSASLNSIIVNIQQGIQSDRTILGANFLDNKNNVRVIAATRYYKLPPDMVNLVCEKAVDAAGKTVVMDASGMTGDENIMLLARQVRERKNLSLRHIGVIVVFVDVEKLGSALTRDHDGIFILQGQGGEFSYILNDKDNLLKTYELQAPKEGYEIQSIGGESYFAVSFEQAGEMFSYVLLTPYEELFADVMKAFGLYIGIFLLGGVVVMLLAFWLTHTVTRDIRLFIQHISRIPRQNVTKLPLYERTDIRDRDVYALQEAFNSMSTHINELVRDNYTKQLLIKETQLQALQSQMNPHFLYNTLNSLYWMAKTAEMSAAADMISSLGILMREAISDKEFVIAIDRELDIVCHYFIIQKHRYEDRLEVAFDISEECSNLVIPKFTIQPLVENAIAYGLECMLESCLVEVRIFTEGNDSGGKDCICQICNSGPAPEEGLMEKLEAGVLQPKGNGIGLLNIHKRIKSVFGEEYGVRVFREGNRTVAQINMSCISVQEYQEEGRNGKHI